MGVIQKTFAATALLAATTGAWAVTATASLSNIKFQVFDLNPLDGIAPSFTILSGTVYTVAYSEKGLSDYQWVLPASSQVNAPGLALASSAAGNALDPSSFTLTSSLSDTALSTYGDSSVYSQAYFTLSLGAGTLLLVTADADVAANGFGSVDQTWLSASAGLEFRLSDNGSAVYNYGGRSVFTGFGYSNLAPSSSGQFSLSFINSTSESMDINLNANAQSYVTTPMATPVPEPTTSAMLLSGLGVAFGVAFRRRDRRA